MSKRTEQREIDGVMRQVIVEEFDDGIPRETILHRVPEPIPSLAVFDKATGELIYAMESNRADVEKAHAELKDTHLCVKDHGIVGIESYRHDGKKLVHKSEGEKP